MSELKWSRSDSSFVGLQYSGPWTDRTGSEYFDNTARLGSGEVSVKFRFNGTGFRILGAVNPAYSGEITVLVDGLPKGTFSQNSPSVDTQVVNFEIDNLVATNHEVVISSSRMYFLLDAIDVLGKMYYPLGYELKTAQFGWKRYFSSHSTVKYLGDWITETHSSYYNGSARTSSQETSKIRFDFKGRDLRLVGRINPAYAKFVSLSIDGKKEMFTVQFESGAYSSLVYETLGLEDRRHTVEIELVSPEKFVLEAIDINYSGYLLHPDEVTDPLKLVPGKRLRMTYSGSGNLFGKFSLMGREYYYNGISDFLVPNSTTKGSFYLIAIESKQGEVALVADRVVHTNISWNNIYAQHEVDMEVDKLSLDRATMVGGSIDADDLTHYSGSTNDRVWATLGKKTGKWYWEVTKVEGSTSAYVYAGVANALGDYYGLHTNNGNAYYNGSSVATGHKSYNQVDDVLGIALDLDSMTITYYVNGEESGTLSLDKLPKGSMLYPYVRSTNTYNKRMRFNFGGAEFLMEPPEGFLPYSTPEDVTPTGYRVHNVMMTGGISASDKDNDWDKWVVNSGLIHSDEWNWTVFTMTRSERENYPNHKALRGRDRIDYWTYTTSVTGVSSDRGYRPLLYISPKLELNATIDTVIHAEDVVFDGTLKTTFESPFEYRIILNGNPLDPPSGFLKSLGSSRIHYTISNKLLNLGQNLLFIEALNRTYFSTIITKNNIDSESTTIISPGNVIHKENVTLMTTLKDDDGDAVRYRVVLNGKVFKDWSDFLNTPRQVSISVPNSNFTKGENVIKIETEDKMQPTPSVEEIEIEVTNKSPKITATLNKDVIHWDDPRVSINLSDEDKLDKVSFRILVNNKKVYPEGKDWTDYSTQFNATVVLSNDHFKLGQNNLVIEYRDDFEKDVIHKWSEVVLVANTHPTLYLKSEQKEIGSQSDYLLKVEIEDLDGDPVSYRVLLNSIEIQPWSPDRPTPTNISILIPSERLNFGENIVVVEYKDKFKDSQARTWTTRTTKTNAPPEIEIKQASSSIYVTISDEENDKVHYRVELNGKPVYPAVGFSVLGESPSKYERHFNSKELNPLGEVNTVEVIARDEFGLESRKSIDFESQYSGLMFSDMEGKLYSTDLGEVLQYLDKGIIISSQTTPSTPVRLTNTYGYPVKNLQITASTGNFHSFAELSYSDNPFIVESKLQYEDVMEYGDSVVFHVRIRTTAIAPPTSNIFKILVKADPIIE